MNEILDEKIELLVSFSGKNIFPLLMKWRKKNYRIKKVNLIYANNENGARVHYFSVDDGVNYFKIRFNPEKMQWRIKELYFEE